MIQFSRKKVVQKEKLPVGLTEFHYWADRIVSKSGLPSTPESQKYALATILINLSPNMDEEEDAFFIRTLRKSAANQVADYFRKEVYAAKQKRVADEAARLEQEKQSQAAVTPENAADGKVLALGTVQKSEG